MQTKVKTQEYVAYGVERHEEFYDVTVEGLEREALVTLTRYILGELSFKALTVILDNPRAIRNGDYHIYRTVYDTNYNIRDMREIKLFISVYDMSVEPIEDLLSDAQYSEEDGVMEYKRADGVRFVTDGANGVLVIPYGIDVYKVYIIA